MSSVTFSGEVATVGAGTRLGDMYDELAERGRAIPAGCGPSVGIAGLTLGGGFGVLGRKHGLTSDRLIAAQVVLADGRVVECDDHHDEDLFWALRGAGGGRFGVITSLVFSTVPAPDATSFHLVWAHTDAAAVVDAWQAWAPAGPDELAASLLITATGDSGEPPVVNLFGVVLEGEADAARLLDELVLLVGTDPLSASGTHLPFRETKRHLVEEAPGDERPGAMFAKTEFFPRQLPGEAIAFLVDTLVEGRASGESRELDFTPWGGAYNRVAPDATAFAHRDARFLLKHGVVVDPGAPTAERAAARRWLARSWASVHPWGSGGIYPNFRDPDFDDWARAYHGANLNCLRRVKARYDPGGFFSAPQ